MHHWRNIKAHLAFEYRRVLAQGPVQITKKIFKYLLSYALCVLLLPVTFALHLGGVRRVTVFTDRIGHLALEPDCLIKEVMLGRIPQRRWIILAPPTRVANRHLLHYLKTHFHIVENPALCFMLAAMTRAGLMREDVARYLHARNRGQLACEVQARWGARAPLLALSASDYAWGDNALEQLGLPKDAWFVCVHVREGGFSPVDESVQAHRNGSITAIIPAAEAIVAQGGWVVRVGDPSMAPLPALPGVIDYAHHPLKSERLDVVLCARARFILGNTSGIALVGTIFGTPCAIANIIPVSTLWFRPEDISIPKLLWSNSQHRYLTFAEAMAAPLANFRYASLYASSDIRVDENSAEDIRDLALEMLAGLNGNFIETETDKNAWSQIKHYFLPHHLGHDSCARIAASFIRKHPALMLNNSKILKPSPANSADTFKPAATPNSPQASSNASQ